jgi:hypothetical protein
MKAIVEIQTDKGLKVVTKEHTDIDVLKEWLCKMAKNSMPTLGYTEDGTFAMVTC